MTNKILRFEDMTVWQDAQDLAVNNYKVTKAFPKDEQYSQTNQIRRSASSVSANIASGSLLETKNFTYLAVRLNYINQEDSDNIMVKVNTIHSQITASLKYFKANA